MIISRSAYDAQCKKDAEKMADDADFVELGRSFIEASIPHRLVYQTTWMGEPVLQLPQDLFAIQELIYSTRPEYVIEVGVAWAGSLLFYADVMRSTGGLGVIGVDVFIPEDLRERILSKGSSTQIHLLEGDSTSVVVADAIRGIVSNSKKVLVHLDSDHTADHVERELHFFAPFVGSGQYLICGDTHVEYMPKGAYESKPYDKGNNPLIALNRFLQEPIGSEFEVDEMAGGKYLLSLNPNGYLRRK